jgi:hypothetical protein
MAGGWAVAGSDCPVFSSMRVRRTLRGKIADVHERM